MAAHGSGEIFTEDPKDPILDRTFSDVRFMRKSLCGLLCESLPAHSAPECTCPQKSRFRETFTEVQSGKSRPKSAQARRYDTLRQETFGPQRRLNGRCLSL